MKNTTTLLFAIALSSASLCAQPSKPIRATTDTYWFDGVAQAAPDTLQKIFSNLGPSTSAYTSYTGWSLLGPNNTGDPGFTQSVAMPFTPKANAHVQRVRVAVSYAGSGANQVNLSLYSDASGVPGTLLAGPVTVTNLPSFGSCCQTTVANFPSLAVTAGTQYWVVADTPSTGTGSDLYGVWDFVPPTKYMFGINVGSGWFSDPALLEEPAGAVYGTIP